MNLDEAAKYLAEKYNPTPYPYQVRYWKSRLVILNTRGFISPAFTQEEIDKWLEDVRDTKQVTIHFRPDVHQKLRERFKGKYGEMSDFVNKVVREAL